MNEFDFEGLRGMKNWCRIREMKNFKKLHVWFPFLLWPVRLCYNSIWNLTLKIQFGKKCDKNKQVYVLSYKWDKGKLNV